MEISKEEYQELQVKVLNLTIQLEDADIKAEEKVILNLLYAEDKTINKIIQRATTAEKELIDLKERFSKLSEINTRVLKDQTNIIKSAYTLACKYEELKKKILKPETLDVIPHDEVVCLCPVTGYGTICTYSECRLADKTTCWQNGG